MRWITNVCRSVHFAPWTDVDRHAQDVQSDLQALLPETREFLDFYLRSASTPDDAPLSPLSPPSSTSSPSPSPSPSPPLPPTQPTPPTPPLDSLEILLAALHVHPRHHVRRALPVPSEAGRVHRAKRGAPRRVCTVVPDLAVYAPDHSAAASSSSSSPLPLPLPLPMVSVNAQRADAPLLPEGTKTSSACAVAASLADLFADERLADPARADVPLARFVMRAVARAVTQALLSTTGYAALTNGVQSVLFRVERREDDDGGGSGVVAGGGTHVLGGRNVVVRVSRAFDADWRGRAGPAHALVALVRLALRHAARDTERAGCVRDCALRVGDAGNAATECIFDDRIRGDYPRLLAQLGQDRVDARASAKVARLLRWHRGVLAVGAACVVLHAETGGRAVVLKYWNEVDLDGLSDLHSEMRIYRFLRDRHAHLLGVAVPDLVVCRDEPHTDAVLVLTHVGHAVFRNAAGALCVGDARDFEEVAVVDERKIVDAARQSLRQLHACGVAHGNVSIRNLRVQRRADGRSRSWWGAWWIDLALAEEELDSSNSCEFDMFRFERERVGKILLQDS